MTRKKKSRKPGVGSIGISKNDKSLIEAGKDKKPKKKTGKAAGNRQQEAMPKKRTERGKPQAKDPRIGSKKPIELGVAVKTQAKKPAKASAKPAAIAAVRTVEQPSIAQQLAAIENDERLQLILAKQEDEESLTSEEIDYYNELMDKYEALSAELPAEDDEEQQGKAKDSVDDDDLWDKLDSNNFSDYE